MGLGSKDLPFFLSFVFLFFFSISIRYLKTGMIL